MRNLPTTMTRLGIQESFGSGARGEALVNKLLGHMQSAYSNMDDFIIKSIESSPVGGWYYANIEYKQ